MKYVKMKDSYSFGKQFSIGIDEQIKKLELNESIIAEINP
jgi:hypothetical protein